MRLSSIALIFVVLGFGASAQCAQPSGEIDAKPGRNRNDVEANKQPASSPETADRKTQADQERFQGVWHVITLSSKHDYRCLFSGKRMYSFAGEKNTLTATFNLDATKNPKQVDFTFQDEQNRTVALRGIYQFQGGMLRFFLATAKLSRPTEFKKGKLEEGESNGMFLRGKQEIPTGAYTAMNDDQERALHLGPKGRVVVKKKNHVVVEGTFLSTKTELILFDVPEESLAGKKNPKIGRYDWKFDGTKLSLTKIDDEDTGRAMAITANAWEWDVKSSATGNGKQNLMPLATYSASSAWDSLQYLVARAFDGLSATRWNSRPSDAQGAWLAARWDQPVTFDEVIVRQAFDRITSLKLQTWQAGTSDWIDLIVLDENKLQALKKGRLGRGPNDGSVNPVFVIPLPTPVKTTGLRLWISSVVEMERGTVSIFEFEANAPLSDKVKE